MILRENSRKHLRNEYAKTKRERNEMIYKYYLFLKKKEGERARYLSITYYSEIIAPQFFISAVNVGRIINFITKQKNYSFVITDGEFEDWYKRIM